MENGKYFLQYTTLLQDEYKKDYFTLTNGFSDTYKMCKEMGEFIWMDQSSDLLYDRSELIKKFNGEEFPISEGTVYISAMQVFHVYQAYKWAQNFKHVKFVVGGPAVDCGFLNFSGIVLPDNVVLTDQSVERYFDVEDFSSEWGLDVPNHIVGDKDLLFTYGLDNNCYWGKCAFCKYPQQPYKNRIRKNVKFEFKHVKPGTKKHIWLQSHCLTPKRIKSIIPNLPVQDDIDYILFVRGNAAERKALESIRDCGFDFTKLKIYMGVEFPSARMLKWMNKGVTPDEFVSFLNLIGDMKINTIISYILGWNNLIESDIEEVKEFMTKLPKHNLTVQKLFLLTVGENTQLHKIFKEKETLVPITCGPFNLGYNLKINEEQQKLNERVRKIINENQYYTFDRYEHGKVK